jgi:hypothetical protein
MYTICSLFAICSFADLALELFGLAADFGNSGQLPNGRWNEFGSATFATLGDGSIPHNRPGDIQLEEIARIPSTRCRMQGYGAHRLARAPATP